MSSIFSKTLENLKDTLKSKGQSGYCTVGLRDYKYFRLDMAKMEMTISHEEFGPTFSSSYHKIGNNLLQLILSLEIPFIYRR